MTDTSLDGVTCLHTEATQPSLLLPGYQPVQQVTAQNFMRLNQAQEKITIKRRKRRILVVLTAHTVHSKLFLHQQKIICKMRMQSTAQYNTYLPREHSHLSPQSGNKDWPELHMLGFHRTAAQRVRTSSSTSTSSRST